jgi:large subunit ribosomal protein L29
MQVELVTLRYKASVGTLTNPGRLREVKRNIARVLTVMKEEVKGARGGAEQG